MVAVAFHATFDRHGLAVHSLRNPLVMRCVQNVTMFSMRPFGIRANLLILTGRLLHGHILLAAGRSLGSRTWFHAGNQPELESLGQICCVEPQRLAREHTGRGYTGTVLFLGLEFLSPRFHHYPQKTRMDPFSANVDISKYIVVDALNGVYT